MIEGVMNRSHWKRLNIRSSTSRISPRDRALRRGTCTAASQGSMRRLTGSARPPYGLPSPAMQVSVAKLYFEDFTPGLTFRHGPRRVERDEMIAFAAEFDPQPMHLDEVAARSTLLGGLSASGWYACCVLMRMCTDAF